MKNATIILIFLLTMIGTSCATLKPEKETEIEIETEIETEEVRFEGITGILVPVDAYGNEIVFQEKEKILVKLIPIIDGERLFDRVLTFNPRSDGSFTSEAGDGNYAVEIFLDGFYVKSFEITIHKDELLDLGVIDIQKIEAEMGSPLKGERTEEHIINEGDVNIEPPSM